ncbi:hypothetical protein CCAX7_009800 [Capsulimonas corticalis]|uniref:Uncharacterized protein n=1 Tax=Capsulimonas corticalis TaxID=2219043 RepID=A0A402CUC5_9BACT|nr:hypothetical protein [Capsulimonas corticalis]BDI28929.1 hypothetical protein CCAX7_009800 [Capsulimonas corticalis]
MFQIHVDGYDLLCLPNGPPPLYEKYAKRARLAEEIGLDDPHGPIAFLAVRRGAGWPFLTLALRYHATGLSVLPGALLIPETSTLFVGAGHRIFAYDLSAPARLWEEELPSPLWAWARSGDAVLMRAERGLSAWDLRGGKQWSRTLETPWDYWVEDGVVHLDEMGEESAFPL